MEDDSTPFLSLEDCFSLGMQFYLHALHSSNIFNAMGDLNRSCIAITWGILICCFISSKMRLKVYIAPIQRTYFQARLRGNMLRVHAGSVEMLVVVACIGSHTANWSSCVVSSFVIQWLIAAKGVVVVCELSHYTLVQIVNR